MTWNRNLAAMALLLPLAGCATLSESDCARGDWHRIGFDDGRWGYTTQRLSHHDKACAKHGFGVDAQAYHAGYADGLRLFCVPSRAFSLGRKGDSYHHQCPPEAESAFMPAYHHGWDVFEFEKELEHLEKEIDELIIEIDDENTGDTARDIAERRLRHVTNDRNRRERDRDALLQRARRLGYENAW